MYLLVSQTAEGRAGTEDVCSPGEPKRAYGSVRRPHETAEGKELHLILTLDTALSFDREERRVQDSAELGNFHDRIWQLGSLTFPFFPFFLLFFFLLSSNSRLLNDDQIMVFLQ